MSFSGSNVGVRILAYFVLFVCLIFCLNRSRFFSSNRVHSWRTFRLSEAGKAACCKKESKNKNEMSDSGRDRKTPLENNKVCLFGSFVRGSSPHSDRMRKP